MMVKSSSNFAERKFLMTIPHSQKRILRRKQFGAIFAIKPVFLLRAALLKPLLTNKRNMLQ